MRAVLQRVTEASVTIDGQKVGEIGKGIMVLFGMLGTDTDKTIDYMLDKVTICVFLRNKRQDESFSVVLKESC